jgi:hypothetical protein
MPDIKEAAEKATIIMRVETMLALAPHVGIDLEVLAFVNRRLGACGSMLDAAEEPRTRAELERLMMLDLDELATAFRALAPLVDRAGES